MQRLYQKYRTNRINREIVIKRGSLTKKQKKILKWLIIVLIILVIVCFLLVFVALPIIFMYSIELQRLVVFTHWGLPNDRSNFQRNELRPGLQNFYLPINDTSSGANISLGIWHVLPQGLLNASITEKNFDFRAALRAENVPIILYFHGTGESRESSRYKYRVFGIFCHVVSFDYRAYADSTPAPLSEEAVVADCVQLYTWLTENSKGPIFLWGHSLGSGIAANTARELQKTELRPPVGLILESAFTKFSEEIRVHPYGRLFAWLPYFEATILKPLEKNGFIFDTKTNIVSLTYPILILAAEDDHIVPYKFGSKLCQISKNRKSGNLTYCYEFPGKFRYKHNFIYEDKLLPLIIHYFLSVCAPGATPPKIPCYD